MDFFSIRERNLKGAQGIEVFPEFKVIRCKDLMVQGGKFYAIWNEEEQRWSSDEFMAAELIDKELYAYREKMSTNLPVQLLTATDYMSGIWDKFKNYISKLPDNVHILDNKITYLDDVVTKTDYVSKRLPYSLSVNPAPAYNELMDTLYDSENRAKIEWAIGSILDGSSKSIQKFLVLYGKAGTGKSTVLNIVQMLFAGYYTTFDAKSLGSNNNAFATEVFKGNPLVAIQHDGDLSRIEDNTKLNSIVSHEEMMMNEKYKASYTSRINAFLFMGTNKPVKITDSKSGIIRRLIDVVPTGEKLTPAKYSALMQQITFELGAIANHCLQTFRKMGKNYYSNYVPKSMMLETDVFFNFVESRYAEFAQDDYTTLGVAWEWYKKFCDDALIEHRLPLYKFREELKTYFFDYKERERIDGQHLRKCYIGFNKEPFMNDSIIPKEPKEHQYALILDQKDSLFDKYCAECPAQYGKEEGGTPAQSWSYVKTKLKDIDTSELHYVRVPENHIVIDFDIKDETGEKSYEKNLEAASKWPSTYAECSKSGKGIHLHYIYDGDPNLLSRIYDTDIEIKVFSGKSSLRRKLTRCNNIPIAHISAGLPLRGEKKMVDDNIIKNEKILRSMIIKNLNKEYHSATKPSIDYIYKLLDDAYNSGMSYDVSDLKQAIFDFAAGSSHQAKYCIKAATNMKFKSDEPSEFVATYISDDIVFYDVEVFPNLFIIVWKKDGPKNKCNIMINPSPSEVKLLTQMKLVGFNNRGYDNHILYARILNYNNEQLFEKSQRIINGDRNAMYQEAYNLSYADIYDYTSLKQSLKKYEIDLHIHHHELGLPWDQPVPEDKWELVASYCCNDVLATEAVFHARQEDLEAREILADISGLPVNSSTRSHVTKMIFKGDKNPQKEFVYTDLSKEFPGYEYKYGKSIVKIYRPMRETDDPKFYFHDSKGGYFLYEPGEGGYVYARPGMYKNVKCFDVESEHPHSIKELNLFGKYTKNYTDILETRLALKHGDTELASTLFDGKLKPYLTDKKKAKKLSSALKIVINSVYGYTMASFDCPFKDPRNVDNIVAKRGALFMIMLKEAVEEMGFTVVHIKTDSIKVADPTPELEEFINNFGKSYGYNFEVENDFERICLVNNAVYIGKLRNGEWTATGAQFAHPYVYKTLFSKEAIEFYDLCEAKTVTSTMYLDMNEGLPDVTLYEEELSRRLYNSNLDNKVTIDGKPKKPKKLNPLFANMLNEDLQKQIDKGHDYKFIGKAGLFCPVIAGSNGGQLVRLSKTGKYDNVTGTSGFRWLEAEVIKDLDVKEIIDMKYFNNLVDDAIDNISKFGDFEMFVSDNELPANAKIEAKTKSSEYPFVTSISPEIINSVTTQEILQK